MWDGWANRSRQTPSMTEGHGGCGNPSSRAGRGPKCSGTRARILWLEFFERGAWYFIAVGRTRHLHEVGWTEEPTTLGCEARHEFTRDAIRRDRLHGKRRGESRRSANVVARERVACQRPSGYGGVSAGRARGCIV